MLRPFIVIGILSAATGAFADPAPLANDDLKDTVSGAIVEIDTPLGTTVPMHFGTDGLVSAEAGVLAPVLGAPKDRGRWWVDGDKLCTKWFRWFDAGVRCLTIVRDGSRIYWRKIDDGETGTGTLVQNPAEPGATTVAKAEAPQAPRKKSTQPARQDRGASPAPSRQAAADSAPVVVAATANSADQPGRDDREAGSAMLFGGAGLLDASARTASVASVPDEPATTDKAPPAQDAAPSRAKAPDAPAKAVSKLPAAPAKAGAKKAPSPPRQASLQAGPAAKRADPKRAAGKSPGRAVATSSSRAIALYRVTGVDPYDVLNVRRGPSEEHVQIASIPPSGRQVEITGQCRADWCPIRYGSVTGWVNRYYLAEEGSRQEPSGSTYARP